MRIISRLFLASYLRLFFTILLGSILAILIIEMLLKFDEVVESRTLAGVVRYFLVRIPSEYLRDTVPVASFAAAFLCIGGPARAREILALKAGGVAPGRLVAPIVLASLLLSLVAFAVNETVVLSAERSVSQLARPEDGIAFRRGSFWYHRGNVVYNIRDADGEARTLLGVRVFRLNDEGRLVESLQAARVDVDDGGWVLTDATRRSFDPSHPEAPPRIERVSEKVLDLGGARDLALLGAGIERLSLRELREYIAVRAADGRDAVAARGRLHRRLADPLSVTLFAWLALPLGFAVERSKSLAVSGLIGIAWVCVYYTLRTTASMLASGGVTLAAVAPWLLLAAFGGFGAWRLSRIDG
ncbi:MAG TPA: LptF/LptG family permease [Myxococcota bacterium]